ncbi:MAG: hypothetical protein ABFD92_18970 [Planctomycetaceae bacterium]|nr:hypothetical protein [Planctomycetaceae bacterium]
MVEVADNSAAVGWRAGRWRIGRRLDRRIVAEWDYDCQLKVSGRPHYAYFNEARQVLETRLGSSTNP